MWNETQDITEKNRKQRRQAFQSAAMWYLHLQHHDRDNDRDHAVTERLQLPSGHRYTSFSAAQSFIYAAARRIGPPCATSAHVAAHWRHA